MAYVESDRVSIRSWLGYSGIVYQNLEAAIQASQSIADGGNRPDSSTETLVKGYLTNLAGVLTAIQALRGQAQVTKAEDVNLDILRGFVALEKEGRLYVGFISDALAVKPARDVFSRIRNSANPAIPYTAYRD